MSWKLWSVTNSSRNTPPLSTPSQTQLSTVTPSKLYDNQVLAIEIEFVLSRQPIRNSTHGSQERRPRWCSLSIGCWINAVCLQYVPHCGIRDVVFQVLQCTLNAIVSPRRILSGESHDGIHDHLSDAWSSWLPLVAGIKLLRDEISMPSQDGIRREDGCDFPQSLATDGMSLYGKQATLVRRMPRRNDAGHVEGRNSRFGQIS